MAITASYSSATRKLSVLGDAAANSIVISRDVAGTMSVNGGAVPVSSGPATVANTDLIEIFGLDLDDVLTLDETNGALPAATMFGGTGNDTLTGGSSGDTLNGDAGVDVLLGRAGVDQLFGGADGDTLTGGTGNDTMDGGDGNDRMIWNTGDGDDVMEGGNDTDVVEVNGSSAGETFSIAQNVTRVSLSRTDAAPFTLDIGTSESLLLNCGGGNDIVAAIGNFIGLITLTIDGGAGEDTISGSNNADLLLGGDDNDLIDGNAGNDTAFLGAGNDVFRWDPGDSSDIVEGQSGTDLLQFNGSNASENIEITANGGRVRFFRDVANITMDLDDVEQLRYNALNAADNVVIGDLTGTDATSVIVDLAGAANPNGGDGFLDSVSLNGTAGDDTITAAGGGGSINVTGLSAGLNLQHYDATDRLVLLGGAGSDTVSASGIAAGQIAVEMQGGLGADTFIGSEGDDLINGGDGNDLALMGAGDDTFIWNPGDDLDTIEGQAGTDLLDFNGNSAAENFTILPNGGRLILFRDVAAVTMDLNDVERINLDVGAGIDNVLINDLTGTDAQLLTINLAGTIGGSTGDAAIDTITANGTAAANAIALSGATSIAVTGLPAALEINQSEATDSLVIAAGASADTINAAALAAGLIALTLRGDGGADTITGSFGADILLGGTENDTLRGLGGADSISGEDGNDLMIWNNGDGSDLLEGGNGTDVAEVNGSSGDEAFVITANAARVSFSRVDPGPFTLDIGTTELLELNANAGNDTIVTSGNLAALIALTLDGGAGNDTILSGNGADLIFGSDGLDFVDGNQGSDLAFLGAGDDVFQWDPGDGSDTVEGEADNDTLLFNGSGGNEIITISPNGGRTLLNRDLGAVTMDLNDVERFIINAGAGTDSVIVNNLTGTDVTLLTVSLAGTIGGSTADGVVDTVTVNGTGGADAVTLTSGDRTINIAGLAAAVTLTQLDATDALNLVAGEGNDTISALAVQANTVALTIDGGGGADVIRSGGDGEFFGGNGDDLIFAGITSSLEVIDGGAGIDTLDTTSFGLTYTVNMVTGATNFGGESFTGFENLVTGAGADTVTGTAAANIIRTNAGLDNVNAGDGDDVVEGGAGGDSLTGGIGVDTLDYASSTASVTVSLNTGSASGGHAAGDSFSGFENLSGSFHDDTLTGNGGSNILYGKEGVDTLTGLGGADFLVGGAGNDVMAGGTGDDTYYVDDSGDAITELAGAGSDRIAASISVALAADADIERIEVVNLTSTNAMDLTGSAIANIIFGNDGVNILRGEAGNDELRGFGGDDFLVGGPGTDLMVGGLGNDTFYVDDASDAIGELAGEGNDRIAASVSFVLSNGADVEILEAVNLAATTPFDLTGSDSANTITGNAGSNILRGEGGADTLNGAGGNDFLVGGGGIDVMNGGTGNDTFYVDAIGDVVNEFAGEGGLDRVVASTSYALSATAHVELLETATQSGTGAINLVGSAIANTINGNDGANFLDGREGSDILTGFGGGDTFLFATALGASNIDTIVGFVTGGDKIALDDAIFAALGAPGALNANAFKIGAAANEADDRIIYNAATGALFYDADGDLAGAAVQFATLTGAPALAAGDFQVI